MSHASRSMLAAILLANLMPWLAGCDRRVGAEPTSPRLPRLVVLVVVDQLRADLLERFRPQFAGGFKTLLESGAVFTNANYEQWPTVTAVGHATIATGSVPADHGIVSNGWFDRGAKAQVAAVFDPTVTIVPTGTSPGASPHRLVGSTLGDELQLATNGRARVLSVGLKDRSAILLGGRNPDGAFWYDDATGTFVTSSYYAGSLPPWVSRFNDAGRASAYFGSSWDLMLPESEYGTSDPDDADGEGRPLGDRAFPHDPATGLKKPGKEFYRRLVQTPFANDLLLEFAREAVTSEDLGVDEVPDILAIALSANDVIGHVYGPYSREVQDATLRTDRALGDLFRFLDDKVGVGAYVVALTSDHGVAPVPSPRRGIGGRYVEIETAVPTIEKALGERFGGSTPWVRSIEEVTSEGIYLDHEVVRANRVDVADVQREAARAAATVPGVRLALAGSDISSGRYNAADQVQRRIAAGYFLGRSPDIVVVFEPFAVVMSGSTGTTHGTPYSYDTHVPLIFYGRGVPAGVHTSSVSVADLAATVSALLGITPPSGCSGRPLLDTRR